MADYNINAITRRVVFTGSAGVGPYAFSFEVLDQDDVAVYFNTTLLTLTTDYTVVVNANGTGSVTIVTGSSVPSTPTASDTIIIIGARDIERVTDFVTAGDLLASSLNEQLDALTIFDQQLAEEGQRSMRAPVFDPALVDDGGTLDMTLPAASQRAGKTLAFDANGNPEAGEDLGTFRGNWAASTTYYKRDIVKDASNNNIYRVNTEHTSSGTTPISSNADVAKFDLIVDAASATASAAAAAASAAAALTSENNASTSETNALASEDNAQDWAVKTNGIVESTDYSSKAWAVGGTGVTNTAGAGPAKNWATETTTTVDGSEYSSKEYAIGTQTRGTTGSAKDWATYTAGTVDGSEYSAKYWAQQAANETQSQRDVYYGAFANDTAAQTWQTGTNGGTVDAGDQYFNTSTNIIRVYDGTAWNDAVVSTTGFATNGFAIAMAIAL